MLILTRRQGETLFIGDDIQVTILRQRGKRIVLGITAPKKIVVMRSELRQKSISSKNI